MLATPKRGLETARDKEKGNRVKNIDEILSGIEGLTDEAKKAIADGVTENYRTIAEVNQKAEKIKQLEESAKEAQAAIEAAKAAGDGNAEALEAANARIAEFEAAEKARNDAAADKKARGEFGEEFAKALGDKKFANSVVEKAVTETAYQLRKNNADMSIEDIIKQAAPDEEGVWANPQRDPHKMPAGTTQGGGVSEITSLEQVKGMTPEEINANWDKIKPLLAN